MTIFTFNTTPKVLTTIVNVLHLPYNISSWASINSQALNEYEGIHSKAIVFGVQGLMHNTENVKYISQKNKIEIIKSIWQYYQYIKWADVVHWYYDDKILPGNLAFKILKQLKKPCIVEWLGSDIRNPLIDFQDNPYFKDIYNLLYDKEPELIDQETSAKQERFAKQGFRSLTCLDMKQYLIEDLYAANYTLGQRINPDKFESSNHNQNEIIRIAHAPSAKEIKGTKYILQAIEQLKSENYQFEFDLIHQVPHDEAVSRIEKCDIFIDQLILGGHGIAALEALSMNKLVVVYLKDYALKLYPKEQPFVNANPSNIYDILKNILCNYDSFKEQKNSGRSYVNKYHHTSELIPKLIDIYRKIISDQI